jgi:glycerol-1-phosphatase
MIGDRLDTDIEGAHRAGLRSLCVLTGVTGLRELVAAPQGQRPTYLSPDLGGLFEPHPEPVIISGEARVGGWTAAVSDGELVAAGSGEVADWWRAVVSAAWVHLDATGEVPRYGLARPGLQGAAPGSTAGER